MRDKFNKFMQGRYGVDAFARFTMGVALVAIIISIFFPGGNRIGALFDTIGFWCFYIHTIECCPEIFRRDMQKMKNILQQQQNSDRGLTGKKYDEPEKDPSYLFMSGMRSEDPYSKRQRQD